MSHYSNDPAMVRVDFWKTSGKWYTTEAVKQIAGWQKESCLIHDGFAKSLRNHFKDTPDRLSNMDATCLEPYHENSHPIQLKAGSWNKEQLRLLLFKGVLDENI